MTVQGKAEWREALVAEAVLAIGPIGRLLVERAAARSATFGEMRRRVAAQMDLHTQRRFLFATQSLAAKANDGVTTAPPTAHSEPPVSSPGAATAGLDRTDPVFVRELIRDVVQRLGPDAEATVREAARRCRTKMQLCLRLATAVSDPDCKAYLAALARDNGQRRQK